MLITQFFAVAALYCILNASLIGYRLYYRVLENFKSTHECLILWIQRGVSSKEQWNLVKIDASCVDNMQFLNLIVHFESFPS